MTEPSATPSLSLFAGATFDEMWWHYRMRRWRLPLWWPHVEYMGPAQLHQQLAPLLEHWSSLSLVPNHDAATPRCYWLGADAPSWAMPLKKNTAQGLLGSECDILVINACAGVNWEWVAAASGCVRGGGIWLLITPPAWPHVANAAAAHLLSYPTDATQHQGWFHHWISQQLSAKQTTSDPNDANTAHQHDQAKPDTTDTGDAITHTAILHADLKFDGPQIIRYQHDVQQWDWPRISHVPIITASAAADLPMPGQVQSEHTTVAAVAATIPDDGNQNSPFLTDDQQVALAAIHKVAFGHRWRPLVINAHRGRGKSALLGIAALQLRHAGKKTIVITGPHPAAVQVALHHATTWTQRNDGQCIDDGLADSVAPDAMSPHVLVPNQSSRAKLTRPNITDHIERDHQHILTFIPVDVLLASKVALDVLFIDEAAAIAQPQLQQLLATYSRVVMASTEHGYEGTGRSFRIKLQPYLQQHFPHWRCVFLQTPIRYSVSDPLEQWLFNAFLLQSSPIDTPRSPLLPRPHDNHVRGAVSISTSANDEVIWWTASALIEQPHMLQRCFTLLCLAHYQTAVTDLWALLDDPSLLLVGVFRHQQLVATAVISQEGCIEAELATAIAQGKRRVRGHLLAQSLAYHTGQPTAAMARSWRVQRIVVEPSQQGQGCGQLLLQQITDKAQQSQVAFIGTSFGATPQLLRFWQGAGFCAVKLSHKLEQASIAPSVLMLKALPTTSTQSDDINGNLRTSTSINWLKCIQQWHLNFSQDLYHYARLLHQQTPACLLLELVTPPVFSLTSHARQQLCRFINEELTLEQTEPALLIWFNQHRGTIPTTLAQPLVQRLWQGYSFSQIAKTEQAATFKQHFVQLLRQELMLHKALFCDDITL